MESEASYRRMAAVAAHPLAELLECPQEAGDLLHGSALCLELDAGETVFRQGEVCQGLYVVVSGQFVRKAERLKSRVTLGPARAGDLVELAAALGDGRHTYTLSAVVSGTLLMLPMEALQQAFQSFPPLRMRLLEELAREVSRAYISCSIGWPAHTRRREPRVAEA